MNFAGAGDYYPTLVAAAVIWSGDKVLIAQRKKGAHLAGKWEFPGGKLEPGESPEDCLVRELKEELGIEVVVHDIFKVVYHRYTGRPVLLLVYSAGIKAGQPAPLDCQSFRWVDICELSKYDFAPADVVVVEKLNH